MSSVRLAAIAVLVGCSSLWSAGVLAQVYRIIGPDGRVTFSDRPPPNANAVPAKSLALPAGSEGSPAALLPTELRTASTRFPVVLYTGAECPPCVTARNFLVRRGIPFTERSVTTEDDIRALQRIAGVARLPFATVGAQHIRGFSEPEWSEYLDAAGYPKVSQLPPGYRQPAATPLVAVQADPRPAQAQAPQQGQQAPEPDIPAAPVATPDNPAGIRF